MVTKIEIKANKAIKLTREYFSYFSPANYILLSHSLISLIINNIYNYIFPFIGNKFLLFLKYKYAICIINTAITA